MTIYSKIIRKLTKPRLKTKKPKRHPQTYLTPKTGEKNIREIYTLIHYDSPKTHLRPVGSWVIQQSAGTWSLADQSGIGHSRHLLTFPDRNPQRRDGFLHLVVRVNSSQSGRRDQTLSLHWGFIQSWSAWVWVIWNQFWFNHTHTVAHTHTRLTFAYMEDMKRLRFVQHKYKNDLLMVS